MSSPSICCYLLTAAEKANCELLCKDGTRAPIDSCKTCHLARVPAHAVVSRKDPDLADCIYNNVEAVKGTGHHCQLSPDKDNINRTRAFR
ncbi:serotransferrin-1-like [Salmo salar]|uniref:Serotransferrin-1-like n=1 Tax=Salmo salar TaxID=8030 RepID=A0ABM3ELR0_SALSA|nr:serotransferrin-1-like [Salmo salar]